MNSTGSSRYCGGIDHFDVHRVERLGQVAVVVLKVELAVDQFGHVLGDLKIGVVLVEHQRDLVVLGKDVEEIFFQPAALWIVATVGGCRRCAAAPGRKHRRGCRRPRRGRLDCPWARTAWGTSGPCSGVINNVPPARLLAVPIELTVQSSLSPCRAPAAGTVAVTMTSATFLASLMPMLFGLPKDCCPSIARPWPGCGWSAESRCRRRSLSGRPPVPARAACFLPAL